MATKPNIFQLFPQLPTELRLKIWDYASPLPRIIELSCPPEENTKARSPISKTCPPSVLHVCQESRSEFIGHYSKLEFPDSSQVILVNYSEDTILFGPGCKHLLPSGRSGRWVQVNRKLMRDIIFSTSLTQNIRVAAFDCGFLVALDAEGSASFEGFFGAMTKLEEAIIVRTEDWYSAQAECRRLKGIGMKFCPPKGSTVGLAYGEANLAYAQKVHLADVEVVADPVEELNPSSWPPQQSSFVRRRCTFLRSRKLLKVRSRMSTKVAHQPSCYSKLSKRATP